MSVNIGINIQRSPNRINQQLREAGVGGKYPKLLLDFADNYYLANGGSKTLANAVTHARAGNATMTDGYGPELVTNGGFDSDLSGWEASGSAVQSNQKAIIADSGGTDGYISQEISTVSGTTYIVDFNLSAVTNRIFLKIGTSENGNQILQESDTLTGHYSYTFTATASSTWITFLAYDANHSGAIDNVSVREMPVIKWAPHNLCLQSEAWDTSPWVSTVNDNVTENAGIAPDGTNTASLFETDGTNGNLQQNINLDPARYTVAFWVKNVDATAGLINIYNLTTSTSITSTGYVGGLTAGVWTLIEHSFDLTASGNIRIQFARDFSANSSAYFWGAHLYRSDLGGMVDNPDQPASRASYVPTTSSAKYLSRVGHHVYNGSAWVNEGVLAESESRVNLSPYSDFASDILTNNLTVSTDQAVSPDGAESATELTETGANDYHRVYQGTNITGTANSNHTFSAYVKRGSGTRDIQLRAFYLGTGAPYVNFDLGDGTVGASSGASGTSASSHTWTLTNTNIQEVGNGWYRISATVNASSDFTVGFVLVDDASTATEQEAYQGDSTSSILIYGAQLEEGSTPSSYIPNYGAPSGATREAESFTIPSANLPWPTPQIISSELVTNGTFDGNADGWTGGSYDVGTGDLSLVSAGSVNAYQQGFDSTKLYLLTYTVSEYTSGNISAYDGGVFGPFTNAVGTYSIVISPDVQRLGVRAQNGPVDAKISSVSVREIDPLSVSIAMDGRVTYADTSTSNEAILTYWASDSSNFVRQRLRTDGSNSGAIGFDQSSAGTFDFVALDSYSPDILVPFDIASRHGSTFVNGAVDGVALTANTTPTALPDLSSTDLNLAYDYMGTISEFRVWDKDLGDAGIVEATNPSLEPSLSLTFEGVGTNSFTVSDWSE